MQLFDRGGEVAAKKPTSYTLAASFFVSRSAMFPRISRGF
jgi:hypothetical protein